MKILRVAIAVLTGIILCFGIYGVFFDGKVNKNFIILGVGIVLVISSKIDFDDRYKYIRFIVFISGFIFMILGIFNFII